RRFRPRTGAARAAAAGAATDRARGAAPRENPRARNRAGTPQCGVKGNRRGEEEQGRGESKRLAERSRGTEGIDPGYGGGGEEGLQSTRRRAGGNSQPAAR